VLTVNEEALRAHHAKHRSPDLGENPWVLGDSRQALRGASAAAARATKLEICVTFFVKKST
jgi:hypothetical protein